MPEPFIAEIKLVAFTFAPKGWAFCQGQLLPINQNQALFALIGTYYGGNGTTNFALPDLRDRTIVGTGNGPGLTPYTIGQTFGAASVALAVNQLPAHNHLLNVSSATGTLPSPSGAHLAGAAGTVGSVYDAAANGTMPGAVQAAGGSLGHDNHQPYLALNYIIALVGIFPSRN